MGIKKFKPFQIGNYRFVELLDRGGSAEVYKVEAADEKGFLKQFAVKKVGTHRHFDDKAAERIEREAKIHRMLTHPNIARLYEVFRAEESLFMVIEYVEGETLRTLMRRLARKDKKFSLAICLQIGIDLCRALSYAHKIKDEETGKPLNLVHRDISPRNVMISRDGTLKLIDFGIASAENVTRNTATGCVRGTLAYMSPEQAGGFPVDQRTDIYSVGLLLLEFVTGGRIFDGDSEQEVLRRVVEGDLPPARKLNPEVPAELEKIIQTATHRIPGDRYQSMDSLARELEKCLALVPPPEEIDLAGAIAPLIKNRSKLEIVTDPLTFQEQSAVRNGFKKLEGALGLELETFDHVKRDKENVSTGWTDKFKRARLPEPSQNSFSVVMAVLFSLAVGIFLAKQDVKKQATHKKQPQVREAASIR